MVAFLITKNTCYGESISKVYSEGDKEIWSKYLKTMEDQNISYEEKSQEVLQLLKLCDGRGGPKIYSQKVQMLKGPALPSGISTEDFFNILKDRDSIIKNTHNIELPIFIKNWSSGNGQKPRRFNDSITNYFQELFLSIHNNFPDTKLNVLDLFHGHMIIDKRSNPNDILIVFHSKEYPLDLEKRKNESALKEYPNIETFQTGTNSYLKRNYIWSLRKNKIWRINTSEETGFHNLIKSPIYEFYPELVSRANTAQENYLGETIRDINFFLEHKGEKIKPFITQGAGTPSFP